MEPGRRSLISWFMLGDGGTFWLDCCEIGFAGFFFPSNGFVFANWSDVCAGESDECTLTLDQARSITANFDRLFDLDVNVTSTGGQVTGTGSIIGCEQDEAGTAVCQESYSDGSQVTLQAEAQDGFEFVGWGGDCAFAASNTSCSFAIAADSSVSASFRETVRSFTLTLRVEGREGSAGDYMELLGCDNARSPCSQTWGGPSAEAEAATL